MKKVLLDTNIVIDLLARREPFYEEAATLFSNADRRAVRLYVSALTLANIHYILLRGMKPDESRQVLSRLKLLVKVLTLDDAIITLALNDTHFLDFEDAIQYHTARQNLLDLIVTRNLKDFRMSEMVVMTAGQANAMLGRK